MSQSLFLLVLGCGWDDDDVCVPLVDALCVHIHVWVSLVSDCCTELESCRDEQMQNLPRGGLSICVCVCVLYIATSFTYSIKDIQLERGFGL